MDAGYSRLPGFPGFPGGFRPGRLPDFEIRTGTSLGDSAVFGARYSRYLFPSGSVQSGADLERGPKGRDLLRRLPTGTRVLVGYVNGGQVTRGKSLKKTAGIRWNDPRTYYRTPSGSVRSGDEINLKRVAPGTLVFLRQ